MASSLSAQYEQACVRAWRNNADTSARDKLIASQQNYVRSVARSLSQYGSDYDDLVQEGNVGLVLALERFDPARGTRLLTYAAYWVRACMLHYVAASQSPLGVPGGSTNHTIFFTPSRALAQSGVTAARDIAAHFHVSLDRAQALLGLRTQSGSDIGDVDDCRMGERATFTPAITLEHLATHETPDICAAAREQDETVKTGVRAALSALDTREQIVARMRWMQDPPATLDAVGKCIGVSRERARQIEGLVKSKLARQLEALREGLES